MVSLGMKRMLWLLLVLLLPILAGGCIWVPVGGRGYHRSYGGGGYYGHHAGPGWR